MLEGNGADIVNSVMIGVLNQHMHHHSSAVHHGQ
jgi:hypothetical protein